MRDPIGLFVGLVFLLVVGMIPYQIYENHQEQKRNLEERQKQYRPVPDEQQALEVFKTSVCWDCSAGERYLTVGRSSDQTVSLNSRDEFYAAGPAGDIRIMKFTADSSERSMDVAQRLMRQYVCVDLGNDLQDVLSSRDLCNIDSTCARLRRRVGNGDVFDISVVGEAWGTANANGVAVCFSVAGPLSPDEMQPVALDDYRIKLLDLLDRRVALVRLLSWSEWR